MQTELDRARRLFVFAPVSEHSALCAWMDRDPAASAETIKAAAHVLALAKCLKDSEQFATESAGLVELATRTSEARTLFAALVRADQEHPEGDRLTDPAMANIISDRIDHLLSRLNPMTTITTRYKHSGSCLSDQTFHAEINWEENLIDVQLAAFDSALFLDFVRKLEFNHGIRAYTDDNDGWTPVQPSWQLKVRIGDMNFSATVARLMNMGPSVDFSVVLKPL